MKLDRATVLAVIRGGGFLVAVSVLLPAVLMGYIARAAGLAA